jgi:hypothetical protein
MNNEFQEQKKFDSNNFQEFINVIDSNGNIISKKVQKKQKTPVRDNNYYLKDTENDFVIIDFKDNYNNKSQDVFN